MKLIFRSICTTVKCTVMSLFIHQSVRNILAPTGQNWIAWNFIFKESHAIHKIMWKYTVQPDTPQVEIYMAHMLYMPTTKARTHISIIFNTYCFSTETMVAWTWLNIMLYIHCLSCSILQLHHCKSKILFSLILMSINKILAGNNVC